MITQNAVPAAPHAMSELVPASISQLQVEDLEFFQKWSKMCALETGEALRVNRLKNLWYVGLCIPLKRYPQMKPILFCGLSCFHTEDTLVILKESSKVSILIKCNV